MNSFQPKTEADVAQVIRETNQGLSVLGGGYARRMRTRRQLS